MESNQKGGWKIKSILRAFKRNAWLMILVVVLATCMGVGYTKIQKPSYTATQDMFFKAINLKNPVTSYNVNAMRAYIDTVLDFCDEGVVLDRAEAYYINYSNVKKARELAGEKYDVEDFISDNEQNDIYVVDKDRTRTHFSKGAISVYAEETEELETSFYFTISYTDPVSQTAADKAQILAYAFNKECIETEMDESLKYFDGIEVEIVDLGLNGTRNNVSKTRTVILFGIIGVALAVLVVYLRYLLDNTVKTTEDIEDITGVSNFAHVGRKKGGK